MGYIVPRRQPRYRQVRVKDRTFYTDFNKDQYDCPKCSFPVRTAFLIDVTGNKKWKKIETTEGKFIPHKCELPLNKKPFVPRTIIRKRLELDYEYQIAMDKN